MQIQFTLFFFFVLFPSFLSAQNEAVVQQSLNIIQTSLDSNKIIDARNELAWEWRYSSIDQAEHMARQALRSSINNKYSKGAGDANMRLGVILKNKGRYEEALQSYEEAKVIRKNLPEIEKKDVASVYNTIGTVYRQLGKYNEAINQYQEGLNLLDKEESITGSLLNNLAITYRLLSKYHLSLQYADSSVAVRTRLEEYDKVADVLLTSGLIYIDLGNYKRANDRLEKANEIFTRGQNARGLVKCAINFGKIAFFQSALLRAIEYYEQALSYDKVLTDKDRADLLRDIGTCYQRLGKIDNALQYFNQSYNLFKSSKNIAGQATVSYSIGETYKDNAQHNEAITHLEKALYLLPDTPATSIHMEIYSSLSKSLGALGDFERSWQYAERYQGLRDRAYLSLNKASNYKLNLEAVKNELKIQKLENVNQTQLIYLMGGIIFLIISFSIAMIAYYRQRQKRRLMKYEIDDLLYEHEARTHDARIEGQEGERKRIALDLHDGIGSMLSTVKLYFSALDSKIDIIRLENREQYQKANDLLDKACEEVRRVAHSMESGTLSKFGLAAQLRGLAKTIRDSKQMEVELTTYQLEERLDDITEIKIYRIIQELVSNALKHAKATKLAIHLNRFDNIVNIQVEDNGIGFDPKKVQEKKGMGLRNIKSRVRALKGEIHFDSVPGRGTAISIDIPVQISKKSLETIN